MVGGDADGARRCGQLCPQLPLGRYHGEADAPARARCRLPDRHTGDLTGRRKGL